MQGRYGMDAFGQFLLKFIIGAMLVSIIFQSQILHYVVLITFIYAYYRIFSKNTTKRYAENQKFLMKKSEIMGKWNQMKNQKNSPYRIYHCPKCRQKVRVPKGKGKISIHCPKCDHDFIKRT